MKINGILLFTLILVFATVILSSCSAAPYDTKWVIGKTEEEIVQRYGEFDIRSRNEEGSYYKGAYLVKEKHVGYLGTDPEEYYLIYFDSNGYAYKVNDKHIIPGG